MANFSCLAAAREQVLTDAGWDLGRDGLTGAPPVTVLVGAERHTTVDVALRYLGLGAPTVVPADRQGRIRVDALAELLPAGPAILCLQAGNLHSGAFDDFAGAIAVAHQHGAWVHIDGAFGLWAGASPAHQHLVRGYQDADSWGTDAHKTLNTPYDGGIAVVADPEAVRTAMGLHASYLLDSVAADPHESVPELSRRARGVPIWAALASLGADGVRALVEGLVSAARELADGIAGIPGARVVNRVDYTQVCVAFESDERTTAVYREILAEGEIMPSPSIWHGRAVIRFSVSSFRTGPAEVRATIAAVVRASALTAEAGSMRA
jgi:glutamate/tyrosine decarboxylase-like PLP-dependent enzyme